MKTSFKNFRLGHGVAQPHIRTKRDGCSTGGLYKSPTTGQTVDASQPVTVSWDVSCLNTTTIDIYLYAPSATRPIIHEWENVDYKTGSYNATLKPGWWNYVSPISLEFTIAPAGQPPYLITTPAGPLFQATYSGSDHDTTAVAGAVEQVNNTPSGKHGPSKAGIAAAVIFPLLLVFALGFAAYIKISRRKRQEKRKRFSEMLDKRMSTLSVEWKSLSGAGANAAVANSMGIPGNRSSSFSFGAIRPMSTVAVESGQAGIGARGVSHNVADGSMPSHIRPGLRTSAFENRVSRVSFAADPRPSRAFHNGFVPPLPEHQTSIETSSNTSPMMSPVQTAGPLTLTPDDIRARMAGQETATRPSIDEVMPALTMMRTGEREGFADDLLLRTQMPTPPSPTHQVPKSPIMGVMPMQPMPANVMSPDDMLRAYAERRAAGAGPAGVPTVPAPTVNYNGTGMRTLYSSETKTQHPEPALPSSQIHRKSLAPTEYSKYDDDDAYVGTAE